MVWSVVYVEVECWPTFYPGKNSKTRPTVALDTLSNTSSKKPLHFIDTYSKFKRQNHYIDKGIQIKMLELCKKSFCLELIISLEAPPQHNNVSLLPCRIGPLCNR